MRRNWFTVITVAIVFVMLLLYLVVETVRVAQVAAHYRFGEVVRIIRPTLGIGEAEVEPVEAPEGVEVINRAGLFFKVPLLDNYEMFDQRIRHVDGPLTQMQLADDNQLIPRVYATWRIKDPVAFQKTLEGDDLRAESNLKNIIDGRTPEVLGKYSLQDIVNTDAEELKFDSIEREIFQRVKESVEDPKKGYGIEVCSLGITWIALPEDATAAVFARMEQEQGKRIKRATIAAAQEERDKMLADAETQAKKITAEGEAEAAKSYEVFARDPALASFLRRLETFVNMARNAAQNGQPITFVVTTKTEPFTILDRHPLKEEGAGEGLPDLELPQPAGQHLEAAAASGGVR
ncbi:MAG: SPFH domain-containing protein [Planctomycetota bacterium]|jgi:membrane protease subunit HflC